MTRPDFSTRRAAGRATAGGTWILVVGLAAAVWTAYQAWSISSKVGALRASLASATSPIPSKAGSSADPEVLRAVASLESATSWPPARVLATVSERLPDGARLRALALSYGDGARADLDVEAREPASYDAFVAALARDAAIEDLAPGRERRERNVEGVVRARFKAVSP